MVNERNILIWFSNLGNISYEWICYLGEYFGNLCEFWHAEDKHIYKALNKYRINADKIIKNRSEKRLLTIIENINNKKFHIITINDCEFPNKLKNIYNPPYVLYLKGKGIKDNPMLSIVGSRKASPYGRWASYNLSKELVKWGIEVVSGMALGIDTEGHRGALDGEGSTIAVLGCGIDICYPASNRELMNRIIDNGTVVSEYPPEVLPLKHHFPARNRIISGLSDGIIVVEAAEKSGSLITVEFGLEQGKEIFALPGNINSINSRGSNKLIKDGAKILLTIEDVIEELRIKYPYINRANDNKTLEELSKKELIVYNIIKEGLIHVDMISYKSKININDLSPIIKVLKLKGYIRELPGNMFTVII